MAAKSTPPLFQKGKSLLKSRQSLFFSLLSYFNPNSISVEKRIKSYINIKFDVLFPN